MNEPRYKHDTDKEIFIGIREEFDVYLAPGDCLVLRYGDNTGEIDRNDVEFLPIQYDRNAELHVVRSRIRARLRSIDNRSRERQEQPNHGAAE